MKISPTIVIAALCIALSPFAATAGTEEDQAACMNDAVTVCSQFIPNRERVAICLLSNRDRISAACRTALKHFNPVASRVKLTTVR